EKYQVCVDALAEYAGNAGFTDCIIGLSGGMDSALVAVMCAVAFGPEHVHGVLMPGPYSTSHSVDDAQEEADNLGIRTQVISILEPYEAFERVLAKPCGGKLDGLAGENTQARCRMVVLMALSNHYGWMLVNTGNRSEAMMGYSTLYGDTAGAFAPIGGLYKTDVYEVARARNEWAVEQGQVPPIPEHVFTKPPSAELSPDQEDEKSLGIDYPSLDRILIGYFEHGVSAEELVTPERDIEAVQAIIRRAKGYAFKRALEPPFPQTKFYEA
ncbi:MAG: NAD(+) synthase, partial [Eggerthellaceae bacterium]|nr:NAD(+) synthase [Eggerthellaceae bacterium]